MSMHKADPLNDERSVIDNLIASSQTLMGTNDAPMAHQSPPTSQYQMGPSKSKIMMKSRRGRTSFTPGQLSDLESAFSNTHYPDFQTRKDLSSRLKIPDDRIQVWFQNRRAKWRKAQRQMSHAPPMPGFHGNQFSGGIAAAQSQTSMIANFHGNAVTTVSHAKEATADSHLEYSMARPSTVQHAGILIKNEPADFIGTPQSIATASVPTVTSQEQLVKIYEKLTTPLISDKLIPENQRTAPSLYSLSAAITSSGQYIVLGPPQTPLPPAIPDYPMQAPSTSAPGKY